MKRKKQLIKNHIPPKISSQIPKKLVMLIPKNKHSIKTYWTKFPRREITCKDCHKVKTQKKIKYQRKRKHQMPTHRYISTMIACLDRKP